MTETCFNARLPFEYIHQLTKLCCTSTIVYKTDDVTCKEIWNEFDHNLGRYSLYRTDFMENEFS